MNSAHCPCTVRLEEVGNDTFVLHVSSELDSTGFYMAIPAEPCATLFIDNEKKKFGIRCLAAGAVSVFLPSVWTDFTPVTMPMLFNEDIPIRVPIPKDTVDIRKAVDDFVHQRGQPTAMSDEE